jgi:hypothetical protein
MTWHFLSSPGSLRVWFPGFNGTTKCSDLLRLSRQARLPSPGDTLRCVCRFAPVGPERRPRAWGSSSGPHCRTVYAGRQLRISQVPGQPLCSFALFFDPGRTTRIRPLRCVGTAPAMSTTKAPTTTSLSGLNSTASELAVYASSGALPHPTQNSLPVAGQALPDGIAYPQGCYEEFQSCFLHLVRRVERWRTHGRVRWPFHHLSRWASVNGSHGHVSSRPP